MQEYKPSKAEIRHRANALQPPLEGIRSLLRAAADPQEREFYRYMLDTFDFESHAEIQSKHVSRKSRPLKFLDLPRWIKSRYDLVNRLQLGQSPPLQILDIGCGPGHFGYVCRYFGHEVLGLDVPDVDIFNDLIPVLGVQRMVDPVRAMKPLRVPQRYDYTTGLSANFFRKPDNTLFTLAEWQFFFDDLIGNHMRSGGKIYFTLNSLEQMSGLHFFDEPFVEFIQEHGGEINSANGVVAFANIDNW